MALLAVGDGVGGRRRLVRDELVPDDTAEDDIALPAAWARTR
ncbi:hypothetical protein ACPA54_06285 [Uniformispora flossi]